jgi:hypothetical protein
MMQRDDLADKRFDKEFYDLDQKQQMDFTIKHIKVYQNKDLNDLMTKDLQIVH